MDLIDYLDYTRRKIRSNLFWYVSGPIENIWYRKYHKYDMCLHLGAYTFELYAIHKVYLHVYARVYLNGEYIMDIVSDFYTFNSNPLIFCTYDPLINTLHIFTADGLYNNIPFVDVKIYPFSFTFCKLRYTNNVIQMNISNDEHNTLTSTFDIEGRLLDIQYSNIDNHDVIRYKQHLICAFNNITKYMYIPCVAAHICEFVKMIKSMTREDNKYYQINITSLNLINDKIEL